MQLVLPFVARDWYLSEKPRVSWAWEVKVNVQFAPGPWTEHKLGCAAGKMCWALIYRFPICEFVRLYNKYCDGCYLAAADIICQFCIYSSSFSKANHRCFIPWDHTCRPKTSFFFPKKKKKTHQWDSRCFETGTVIWLDRGRKKNFSTIPLSVQMPESNSSFYWATKD